MLFGLIFIASAEAGADVRGSGVIISGDGVVLSSAHVVRRCRAVTVQGAGFPASEAEIVSINHDKDLAVLKARLQSPKHAVFGASFDLLHGGLAYTFGYPGGYRLGMFGSTGRIIGKEVVGQGTGWVRKEVNKVSSPVIRGFSGGPAFNACGHLIGVISKRLDGKKLREKTGLVAGPETFVTTKDAILRLMEGTQFPKAGFGQDGPGQHPMCPTKKHMEPTDVKEFAQFVTVSVECHQ